MHETQINPTTEPVEEGPAYSPDEEEDVEVTPENLLDQLRQERESQADEETLISVPGYERVPLLVKYRMMDGDEINKIGKRSRKIRDVWSRNFTSAIDIMIAAAIGVYVEVNGRVQPLTYEGKEVMGYSPDLAAALGFKSETARQTVIGTFKNKDLYIANHSQKLQRWFSGVNSALDEDYLGE